MRSFGRNRVEKEEAKEEGKGGTPGWRRKRRQEQENREVAFELDDGTKRQRFAEKSEPLKRKINQSQ